MSNLADVEEATSLAGDETEPTNGSGGWPDHDITDEHDSENNDNPPTEAKPNQKEATDVYNLASEDSENVAEDSGTLYTASGTNEEAEALTYGTRNYLNAEKEQENETYEAGESSRDTNVQGPDNRQFPNLMYEASVHQQASDEEFEDPDNILNPNPTNGGNSPQHAAIIIGRPAVYWYRWLITLLVPLSLIGMMLTGVSHNKLGDTGIEMALNATNLPNTKSVHNSTNPPILGNTQGTNPPILKSTNNGTNPPILKSTNNGTNPPILKSTNNGTNPPILKSTNNGTNPPILKSTNNGTNPPILKSTNNGTNPPILKSTNNGTNPPILGSTHNGTSPPWWRRVA
ncbi:hypothetical protein Bbelb_261350 [Branchiostoma belcheri]|nr:hypothetical protein Bbelb_261350 [Branchiostoma belcheri]